MCRQGPIVVCGVGPALRVGDGPVLVVLMFNAVLRLNHVLIVHQRHVTDVVLSEQGLRAHVHLVVPQLTPVPVTAEVLVLLLLAADLHDLLLLVGRHDLLLPLDDGRLLLLHGLLVPALHGRSTLPPRRSPHDSAAAGLPAPKAALELGLGPRAPSKPKAPGRLEPRRP